MIIKLNEGLRDSLFEYLKEEAEINLFILGDVEIYGFDKDFQQVWAQLDKDMSYRAVLLRFKTHFVFYSKTTDYKACGFANIIKSFSDAGDLAGKKDILQPLLNELQYKKIREQYFAKLSSKDELAEIKSSYILEKATIKDAEEMYSLRQKIVEFVDFKTTLENTREALMDKMGRHLVIRLNSRIVGSAATTVEGSMSAMIGGVMTDPDYRKKGIATACVHKICYDLLNEGKSLCLFYDNPTAGSIYKGLGFKEIGQWSSIFF